MGPARRTNAGMNHQLVSWSIEPTAWARSGPGKLKIRFITVGQGLFLALTVENKVPVPRCQDFLYNLNGHSNGARTLINHKDHD